MKMTKDKYIHDVGVDPGTDLRSERCHLVYILRIHNLCNGSITEEFYNSPREAEEWYRYWNEQEYTSCEYKTLITDKDYISC